MQSQYPTYRDREQAPEPETPRFIDSFPLSASRPSPRSGQRIACRHLDCNPDSTTILQQLPTGTGKSAHALTVANHCGSATILSPNRTHVDQYQHEYPEIAIARGAADHKCQKSKPKKPVNCAETKITKKEYCAGCPYVAERNAWLDADVRMSTVQYELQRVDHPIDAHPLLNSAWLIVDEAHKLEAELLQHTGVTFSAQQAEQLGIDELPIPPSPQAASGQSYNARDFEHNVILPFIDHVVEPAVRKRIDTLKARLDPPKRGPSKSASLLRKNDRDELAKEIDRLSNLVTRLARYTGRELGEVVAWTSVDVYGNGTAIHLKPFSVARLFQRYIARRADRVLLMSATLPEEEILSARLGLAPDTETCRIPSPFPLHNHRIHYLPVGSMRRQHVASTSEEQIEAIRQILEGHPNQRGIIDSHTTAHARRLRQRLGDRLILAIASGSGEDALQHKQALAQHRASRNSFLVSPSMTEGIDLPSHDSEVQIICKTPYPFLGDPWTDAHHKAMGGQDWYASMTASTLVRAMGRSLRSETDHCTTYILDADFAQFFGQHYQRFPTHLRPLLADALTEERAARESVFAYAGSAR